MARMDTERQPRSYGDDGGQEPYQRLRDYYDQQVAPTAAEQQVEGVQDVPVEPGLPGGATPLPIQAGSIGLGGTGGFPMVSMADYARAAQGTHRTNDVNISQGGMFGAANTDQTNGAYNQLGYLANPTGGYTLGMSGVDNFLYSTNGVNAPPTQTPVAQPQTPPPATTPQRPGQTSGPINGGSPPPRQPTAPTAPTLAPVEQQQPPRQRYSGLRDSFGGY